MKVFAFISVILADFVISFAVNIGLMKFLIFGFPMLLVLVAIHFAAVVGNTILVKKVYDFFEKRTHINKIAYSFAAVLPMTLPAIYLWIKLNEPSHMKSLGDIAAAMTAIGIFAYAAEAAMGLVIAFGIKRKKVK
ncbi:MAG TPA: hypothetical protein DEQ68_08740 [Ruminococcaceae bacterium]|nr:hypothetical protein [Oscillospiraceae bacterium]